MKNPMAVCPHEHIILNTVNAQIDEEKIINEVSDKVYSEISDNLEDIIASKGTFVTEETLERDYYNKLEIDNKNYLTSIPDYYCTEEEVGIILASHGLTSDVDLNTFVIKDTLRNYYNKSEIDDKIKNVNIDMTPYDEKLTDLENSIEQLSDVIENEKHTSVKFFLNEDVYASPYKYQIGTIEVNGEPIEVYGKDSAGQGGGHTDVIAGISSLIAFSGSPTLNRKEQKDCPTGWYQTLSGVTTKPIYQINARKQGDQYLVWEDNNVWSEPFIVVPEKIESSIESHYVVIYIDSPDTPDVPTNANYDFATEELTGLDSWSTTYPETTYSSVWFSTTTFYSDGTNSGWSIPIVRVTPDLLLPEDTYSNYFVEIFKWSNEEPETPIGGSFDGIKLLLDSCPVGWYTTANGNYTTLIWVSRRYFKVNDYNPQDIKSTDWSIPVRYLNLKTAIDKASANAETYYASQLSNANSELNLVLDQANTIANNASTTLTQVQNMLDSIEIDGTSAQQLLTRLSKTEGLIEAYGWSKITKLVGKEWYPETGQVLNSTVQYEIDKPYQAYGTLYQGYKILVNASTNKYYWKACDKDGNILSQYQDEILVYIPETEATYLYAGWAPYSEVSKQVSFVDSYVVEYVTTSSSEGVIYSNAMYDAFKGKFVLNSTSGTLTSADLQSEVKNLAVEASYDGIYTELSKVVNGETPSEATISSALLALTDNELRTQLSGIFGEEVDTTILSMTPTDIVLQALSSTGSNVDNVKSAIMNIVNDRIVLSVTNKDKGASFEITVKDGESQALIDSDTITITGTTIAKAIESESMNINNQTYLLSNGTAQFAVRSGNPTEFNVDGTGHIAGDRISWQKENDQFILKVKGIIDALGGTIGGWTIGSNTLYSTSNNNELVISPSQLYALNSNKMPVWQLNQDGSGSLGNGAISWNKNGQVTISENVDIKKTLKVDVADVQTMLNSNLILIGGRNSCFNADGSGYVAGGAIAWDAEGNTNQNVSVTGVFREGVTYINKNNYLKYMYKPTKELWDLNINNSNHIHSHKYDTWKQNTYILDIYKCSSIIEIDEELIDTISVLWLPYHYMSYDWENEQTRSTYVKPIDSDGILLSLSKFISLIDNTYSITVVYTGNNVSGHITLKYGCDYSDLPYGTFVTVGGGKHEIQEGPNRENTVLMDFNNDWTVPLENEIQLESNTGVILKLKSARYVYMTSSNHGYNSSATYTITEGPMWEKLHKSEENYAVDWWL